MDKNELIGLLEDLSDYASAYVEWECENCSCRGCPGEENCSRISECTKAMNSASKLIEELRIGNATRTVRKTATRRKGNRHDENKKNKRKK